MVWNYKFFDFSSKNDYGDRCNDFFGEFGENIETVRGVGYKLKEV